MNCQPIVRLLQRSIERLVAAEIEVEALRDRNVDDAQEALVLFLELFLVKDLNGDDARILDIEVERFVPVWVSLESANTKSAPENRTAGVQGLSVFCNGRGWSALV